METSYVGIMLLQWTGLTLSKEQLAEAQLRVKQAGLDDKIQLLFCDYRSGHHSLVVLA